MNPIEFPGFNVTYAKDQPEYLPLPAMKMPDGEVYTCWQLSDDEIAEVMISGKIYLKQSTFNQPLQPILPMVSLDSDIDLL